MDEAQELLNTYYEENPKSETEDRTEEADKVAVRIAKILSEKAFIFAPNEYISIYKKLFMGIYGHAGTLRDYTITKKEWVLNGATVLYGSASELRTTLEYDFSEEKKLGPNYNDLKTGVYETTEYLELFLRNLLLDEKNELHNRSMHISGMFEKADIESAEVDIEDAKVDIRDRLLSFSEMISEKTINHALALLSKCGNEAYFGRTLVENIIGLKPSGASKLIRLLVDSKVIVPVTGHGKGKYRFQ